MAEVEEGNGAGSARSRIAIMDVDGEQLICEMIPIERRREILNALADKAAAGDVQVAAFLFDRIYGRPGASAPRKADAAVEKMDLGRLDDREVDQFVRLLEKASGRGEFG